MGLTDNWQTAKKKNIYINNWQLTNSWKVNWQPTFVVRFTENWKKKALAIVILLNSEKK